MAGNWSGEQEVAEHRDVGANAMAVDCTGEIALLAGRRAHAFIKLNKPTEVVKKISRHSKWEISAVQWNPHMSHRNLFITASNQRGDVWSWDEGSSSQQGSLKAHTRVISDVDWSPTEATSLATCSVDAFTYLWDTRDVRKPTQALQAVAGASQVQWNKVNSHLLATTHDGDIRIWDPRKGSSPVQYIAAHLSKIHGLDWSPTSEYHLATSSQDCTVKFWDVTNPKLPQRKLPSPAPVWRARHTPFGEGLVSVVVPQLRRGENTLFLWSLDPGHQRQSAIYSFIGHTDIILEFQWRKPETDGSDYQLVTWSKDQTLRLWKIDAHLQKLCGRHLEEDNSLVIPEVHHPPLSPASSVPDTPYQDLGHEGQGQNSSESLLVSNPVKIPQSEEAMGAGKKQSGLSASPMIKGLRSEDAHSPSQPTTLKHEFQLVNFCIPNVTVEESDPVKRCLVVSANSTKHMVHLNMNFPPAYPNNTSPTFTFGASTTLDKATCAKLIASLRETSHQHVVFNRSCIEPCLRQLSSFLENLAGEGRQSPDSEMYNGLNQPASMGPPRYLPIYSALQDQSVPFPRTSGASFCGVGLLVCFSRVEPSHIRRSSAAKDATPRAMSALSVYTQKVLTPQGSALYNLSSMARSPPSAGMDNHHSLTNYYHKKDRSEARKSRPRSKSKAREMSESSRPAASGRLGKQERKPRLVLIYNAACLLPIHRQLAENYVIDTRDVSEMCRKNAIVAKAVGRKDLFQVWSLAALASDKNLTPDLDPNKGAPWACHPFGRRMLRSLLDHYTKIHDIQTLAMLSCAFGDKFDPRSPISRPLSRNPTSLEDSSSNYNMYHTIHPSDTTLKGWTHTLPQLRRSNSMSDVTRDYQFVLQRDPAEIEIEQHQSNMRLLDVLWVPECDLFIQSYADILYRWGLLSKRALVMKYLSSPPQTYPSLDLRAVCQHCGSDTANAKCIQCWKYSVQCVICHISVRGASSFCLQCGHGGHSEHMQEWYASYSTCPTGCGCSCLHQSTA